MYVYVCVIWDCVYFDAAMNHEVTHFLFLRVVPAEWSEQWTSLQLSAWIITDSPYSLNMFSRLWCSSLKYRHTVNIMRELIVDQCPASPINMILDHITDLTHRIWNYEAETNCFQNQFIFWLLSHWAVCSIKHKNMFVYVHIDSNTVFSSCWGVQPSEQTVVSELLFLSHGLLFCLCSDS